MLGHKEEDIIIPKIKFTPVATIHMTTRGADRAPRTRRGPPTEATKQARVDVRKAKAQRCNQQGFQNLFSGAGRSSSRPSSAAPAAVDTDSGAPAAGGGEETTQQGPGPNPAEPAEQERPPQQSPPCRAARAPPPRAAPRAAPRSAPDLGVDSEDEDEDTDDEAEEPLNGHSQQLYAAVSRRLQLELSKRGHVTDNWLLQHLRVSGWWLRAGCVTLDATGALVLRRGEQSGHYRLITDPRAQADVFYDRDLLVCMPDEMWGMTLKCPSCGEGDQVKVHGYSEQPARRVKDIGRDFDVMGRRHCCNRCYQVRGGDSGWESGWDGAGG